MLVMNLFFASLSLGLVVTTAPAIGADGGKKAATAKPNPKGATPEQDVVQELSLLDALRDHQVTAKAEGIGDGRITLTITNHANHKLRVVLPPGIITQGATGQMGGMGGMGGGMMGGGMGGGTMGEWAWCP